MMAFDQRPTDRQIQYAESLLTKAYGEITLDIYNMSKSEISELIDKLLKESEK
jgi:hypothetical protein